MRAIESRWIALPVHKADGRVCEIVVYIETSQYDALRIKLVTGLTEKILSLHISPLGYSLPNAHARIAQCVRRYGCHS